MEKENKELNSMELIKLIFEEVKRNSKELNCINEELKIHRGILNEHSKKLDEHDIRFEKIDKKLDGHDIRFEKIDKKLDDHDNKFNRIEQKLDSNFKYLDEKIDNTKNKLISAIVEELDKFSVSTTKLINNLESKIRNEQEERILEISKMKGINDYNKLILKNLESRISILEEESEKYNTN